MKRIVSRVSVIRVRDSRASGVALRRRGTPQRDGQPRDNAQLVVAGAHAMSPFLGSRMIAG